MKKLLFAAVVLVLTSCNISVDKQNDRDSASKFDSTLNKVDSKLEEWGDTAKEKFKDLKQEVKDRLRKDSAEKKK